MNPLLEYFIGVSLCFVQFSHTCPIITSETSSGCTFERIRAPVMAADPNSWAFMDDILPFRVPTGLKFYVCTRITVWLLLYQSTEEVTCNSEYSYLLVFLRPQRLRRFLCSCFSGFFLFCKLQETGSIS